MSTVTQRKITPVRNSDAAADEKLITGSGILRESKVLEIGLYYWNIGRNYIKTG